MSSRIVPDMAFDMSSSDDDAPEEISVSSSRQQGISQLKGIQEALKKSRDAEKERRRQRNEMFRIQKENKLMDLSKRKLPDDVLAAISAKAAKISNAPEGSNQATSNTSTANRSFEEQNSDDNDGGLSDSGVEDVADEHSSAEEFIPIGNKTGLALVTPGALERKTQTAVQKALSFKHDRLYGQPTIPRETTKQRRSRAAKRRAIQMK